MAPVQLTAAEREWMTESMNRLPFVSWDRMAASRVGAASVDALYASAFGWIHRADRRSDFVVLIFDGGSLAFATSSAEHSAEIAELLYGYAGEHEPCQRVEDVLPGVHQRIALYPALPASEMRP